VLYALRIAFGNAFERFHGQDDNPPARADPFLLFQMRNCRSCSPRHAMMFARSFWVTGPCARTKRSSPSERRRAPWQAGRQMKKHEILGLLGVRRNLRIGISIILSAISGSSSSTAGNPVAR